MNTREYSSLYFITIFAALVLIFELSQFISPVTITEDATTKEVAIETSKGEIKINPEKITQELLPERKILPATWQGIPYQLAERKIVDIEKLKAYSVKFGQKITEDDLAIFEKDYNGNIEITPNNSVLIYNVLWAIGFVNKSPILDYELEKYGWDTVKNLAGYYFSFANLGNGSTLPQSGYNYLELTTLSAEQKNAIMKIAGKSAVPSCGNPLHLPDCSCSFAIGALIQLMASQGFTEKQIYQAMKDIYPYRFPGIYVRHAVLFKITENKNWQDIDAEQLVSMEFSSAHGVARVSNFLANVLNVSGGQKALRSNLRDDH